jgi:hypothetical protein
VYGTFNDLHELVDLCGIGLVLKVLEGVSSPAYL